MWVRLDDAMLDNPKIIAAGPLGTLLHVAAIVWSARNLTDGFIPLGKVATLLNWAGALEHVTLESDGDGIMCTGRRIDSEDFAYRLVDLCLWHEVPGGFQIHDFLDYNRSKKQVLAERERWAARQEKQRESRRDSGVSHTLPVPVPVPPQKKKLAIARKEKGPRWTRVPAHEILTEDRIRQSGLERRMAEDEWRHFTRHTFEKSHASVDATWQNWCLRVERSTSRRRAEPTGGALPPTINYTQIRLDEQRRAREQR